jgi:N-methylhydantoinase B
VREFRLLSDGGASVEGEGHRFKPWGLFGGRDGATARLTLRRADTGESIALPSKVPHMATRHGDIFICEGPAGGGYGDPFRRPAEIVRADILDGLISTATAERDYGVALTSAGEVDVAATGRLRTGH